MKKHNKKQRKLRKTETTKAKGWRNGIRGKVLHISEYRQKPRMLNHLKRQKG